jgi:hypothetical protein
MKMFDEISKQPIIRINLIWATVWLAGFYVAYDLGHALLKVITQAL